MFSAATFALLVGLVSAVQIVPTQFTVLSNGKPTVVSGSSLAVDSPQPTVRYYCANLGGSGPGTICYNGLSNQGNGRKLTYDSDTKRAASRRASKDVCGKGAKRLLKWQVRHCTCQLALAAVILTCRTRIVGRLQRLVPERPVHVGNQLRRGDWNQIALGFC